MPLKTRVPVLLAFLSLVGTCCSYTLRNTVKRDARPPIVELWADPVDLGERDLFKGPADLAPPLTDRVFRFVAKDTTGASPGYDVKDSRGTEWSVKLGPEVQPEIVASRLLWAMGYHQPPTYYVTDWQLTGSSADPGPMPPARFRPDLIDYKVEGAWSWFENPFVGTRAFEGLIAANVLINNWDFKTSNDKVYERRKEARGDGPRRLYVVRDLGASFGRTSQPALLRITGVIRSFPGTKNDIEGFEKQGYVKLGKDGKPQFDYLGVRRDLLDGVKAESVVWVCQLMSRISDQQYADAFRAANYTPELTTRYVKRMREKIAEGLKLAEARVSDSVGGGGRSSLNRPAAQSPDRDSLRGAPATDKRISPPR